MKNPIVLIKMTDELVSEVSLFVGADALPAAMKAFEQWTGVSYLDFVKRFWLDNEDSLDILGEEFVGTALYFDALQPALAETHNPTFEPMISLSTAHITPEADRLLQEGLKMEQLIHYPKAEYGYFICVLDKDAEMDETCLPSCLQDILAYARSKGGQWVMLDRDADTVPDLPVYDW
ncbi:DUF5983 family protein [Paenibacillus taichungensis]|uniref:DUF5983 family protein n=1 Tax=Paenibacillus taichungensis TaxID=484184 RepID=UPI0035D66B28